jgi:hypothetical protein
MRKITKATFKSFIKKNRDKLHIKITGILNPIEDGMDFKKSEFEPAKSINKYLDYTLGIEGIYLVDFRRGNYFKPYKDDNFTGIEVSNCCTYFTVAVPN